MKPPRKPRPYPRFILHPSGRVTLRNLRDVMARGRNVREVKR